MIRFLDILFSSVALLLLSPLFFVVSILLLCTGEHEIFYLQERIGFGGKTFRVYKFATMLKESPNLPGGLLTQDNDPRVLPFGAFLRKTKINELPQLINILQGSMSVVGPRPQAPIHYNLYNENQKYYISRLKPGLTGIGSLVFRNEEEILSRSPYDFDYTHDKIITPYKGELERWYYHHSSLRNYMKIILLTAYSLMNSEVRVMDKFDNLPPLPDELHPIIV